MSYTIEKTNWYIQYCGYLVYLGGTVLFGVSGLIADVWFGTQGSIFLAAIILWNGFYIARGLDFPDAQTARIYERFGVPVRVTFPGFNIVCLKGIIDHRAHVINLKYRRTELYQSESGDDSPSPELDFTDGTTATVVVEYWWRVEPTREGVLKFSYAIEDPESYLRQTYDDFIRPELQKYSADQASENSTEIARLAVEDLADKIKAVSGIEPEPTKGLLIRDIVLPPEVEALRLQRLEGTTTAEKYGALGTGYAQAINAIHKAAKDAGHKRMKWDEARLIFERQRGLETVEKTGANITFVSPDIGGVLKTFGIADARPSVQAPKDKKED